MDDFVIEKISRGMLIVSLNGHEISFEGEMFFPNNEFHFSLYAKTAKFTKTNQILSKEELDNILEHLKKEFILKNSSIRHNFLNFNYQLKVAQASRSPHKTFSPDVGCVQYARGFCFSDAPVKSPNPTATHSLTSVTFR